MGWYAGGMPVERANTEPGQVSVLLRAADAGLESLKRFRQHVAEFVRLARLRPPWQPECPFLVHDDELVRRLDSCANRIERARKRLVDQRAELLRIARLNSPFACRLELQQRIESLSILHGHALARNVKKFLEAWKAIPAGVPKTKELKVRVQRLREIARLGLGQAARMFADSLAFPGTPLWRKQHDEYINSHASDWSTVSSLLSHDLEDARSDRREQEERHGSLLERAFENELAAHQSELRDAIADVEVIRTEAQALHAREVAAVDAVQKIWRATQAVWARVDRRAPPLSETDQSLAESWAQNLGRSAFLRGAMKSARCAELVALAIYREISGKVEDLSVLQKKSPADCRWQDADVAAAGRWIDVKNATRSFSSRNSYAEHCVKRFKADRQSRQVIVSGFLSEYVANGQVGFGEQVVWLGETTRETINALRRQFETDYLRLDLDVTRATRIPPCLFEYPDKCYAERNLALAHVSAKGFVLPRVDCPIGLLVLIDRVQRALPVDQLAEEASALGQRLAATRPTRPLLFLHILDRFCATARNGISFPSTALRQIVFSADHRTPLAVFDPFETVKELIEVLDGVAKHCVQHAVAFKSFRLAGSGVFQGRHSEGAWRTIFAYCGGWRKLSNGGTVKCGQNPLFIGQNNPCGICGKLACHRCGFCSKICPSCSQRQEGWPRA